MAKRNVNVFHLEFWHDPFILRALSLPQAFFYSMLLTRWPEHTAGIIDVSIDTLHAQFRPREFSRQEVEDTLALLERAGKVMHDADVLWLVNYLKRHGGEEGGRPDWLAPSVARALAECHSRPIYEAFIHKYRHHPLFPAAVPPYRYGEDGPPEWFIIGGPEKKVKRPPVKQEPALVERIVPEVRAVVDRVWAVYVQTMDSALALTDKRRDKILARLSDKIIDRGSKQPRAVTEADLVTVIQACRASAFHMGGNEEHKRYNIPEDHLFRNQEQVEKWLQAAATNHRPAAAPARQVTPPPLERPPLTDEERDAVERDAAESRAKVRAMLSGLSGDQ